MKKEICFQNFKEQNVIRFDYIAHQLDKYQNSILGQYDITSKQAKILTFLYFNRDKNILQRDLEVFLSNTSSTITSIIGNLEKNGFIVRHNCEEDGRAKYIVMTEKGYEVQKHIFMSLKTCENVITNGLSVEEQNILHDILAKVCNNIKNIQNK